MLIVLDSEHRDHNLVRRMSFGFQECVENQKVNLGMTMDFYDYGRQQPAHVPSAAEAYDLTPLLSSVLGKIRLPCSSA